MAHELTGIDFPLSLQTSIDELQQQVVHLFVLNQDATNAINDFLKKMCLKVVQFIYSKNRGTIVNVNDIRDAIVTFFPKSFAENIIDPGSGGIVDPTALSVPQVRHFLQCTNFDFEGGCAVFLTYVLEFIAKEIIESAAEAASVDETKQISLYHICRVIWGDVAIRNTKPKSKTQTVSFFNGDLKLQELSANVGWSVFMT